MIDRKLRISIAKMYSIMKCISSVDRSEKYHLKLNTSRIRSLYHTSTITKPTPELPLGSGVLFILSNRLFRSRMISPVIKKFDNKLSIIWIRQYFENVR